MFSRAAEGWKLDQETARLLLAPILLDTVNLDEKFGKTTPWDKEETRRLASLIDPQEASRDPQGFNDNIFKPIQAAKFDISSLSTPDLLRKDFKEVSVPGSNVTIGVSSVTMSLAGMVANNPSSFVEDLSRYCSELHLGVLVIMAIHDVVDPKRCDHLFFFPAQTLLS